jgi:lipopolysaccharide biosynthesis regulator YciM
MSDLIKNLESAIENGNEKYGFVDMLLLVNCRNEISRLQGIINKALQQQPAHNCDCCGAERQVMVYKHCRKCGSDYQDKGCFDLQPGEQR